ncbi:SusD/RagB family nutrient-binding outer membrane lipoprotein [Arcicella rigui]|uniref:SusD/RagB family nutrient-binding outer membrane lipoprotein n=1 Tax=Arcicella rigui TaxID=797020 RepID=A0ABU5QDC7_9BACT|nr:SusD/RagB family nutrient-binding outer membrane lipoprotein [Arcicella rigui]MEA5140853.1 SusD/RagB family nutrient-binding outer membrane lipoprotein [Arcicella rigui]
MKHTYKIIKRLIWGIALVTSVGSCSITELDINNDPNNPVQATPDLLLPNAELAAINNIDIYNTAGFAGQLNSADDFNLNNSSYNGTWNFFYQSTQNIEGLINATKDVNSPHYLGIAQTLKAFAVGNFVDTFGDIPYTQAWLGNSADPNFAPVFDKDSDVYEALIKLCDAAIANFAKSSPVTVKNDIIYSGSITKWVKLAKSVKLRLLLNSRKGRATGNSDLIAAFNAGGYITSSADDFTFKYGSQLNADGSDGRHPWFQNAYLGDNGFSYISHQLMSEMILNKDPRLPFYFYRQTSTVLDPANPTDRGTIPYGGTYLALKTTFLNNYKKVYGTLTSADLAYIAGFFGRDRGDNTGAPQDGALRTAPGCYPAGGLYSGREIAAKALTGGTKGGNGILPLITSNDIKFYQIEAILDAGLTGDARSIFEAAIREHITRVVNLGLTVDPTNAKAPASTDITDYVNSWLAQYDAAPTNTAKLNIVMKQAWFCRWGQGTETWNGLRRLGYPTAIQNPILKPIRQFALRKPYPSQEGNLNPNAVDKVTNVIFDRDPIFWDKVKLKWEF